MPRQTAFLAENNFKNGLITEATGLNFPENSVVDTDNCVFNFDGSVDRRLGFDFEPAYDLHELDRSNLAISTYLWENVSGNGDITFLVKQVGRSLYFYRLNESSAFSLGFMPSGASLNDPPFNTDDTGTVECQYASGNGYLFVTHPYCRPLRISYDPIAETFSTVVMELKIRDFEGDIADTTLDDRPTTDLGSMNVHHRYNLQNQGWTVTNLMAWDTGQTTMPSNTDVMWRFKTPSNVFDFTATTTVNIVSGNSRAPKGHYILDALSMDRDAVSGLSPITFTGTGGVSVTTCAFFAGRMFYAGIPATGFNSKIYFSQIVEDVSQYAKCYQANDPTAEDLFDLLPSDGGIIDIQEAGTIIKLATVPGGLCAFSANGVWLITGSQGIGFTATDYSIQKISNVPCLTPSSFVNVEGMPCWWNADDICMIQANSNSNLPTVVKLSHGKIDQFLQDIPISAKRTVKGTYSTGEKRIQWLYKSTNTNQVDEVYEYDRILNYDIYSSAFYPWSMSLEEGATIHALVSSNLPSRFISQNIVIDDSSNNVVTLDLDTVVAFSTSGTDSAPFIKYLVSYGPKTAAQFTFAEENNENLVDWETITDGVTYESFFDAAYKLKGAGLTRFGNNFVRVYSRTDEPVKYYFQAMWDYAITGNSTGRWSVNQVVEHTDMNYSNASKRLKVRGYGLAMQYRVSSIGQNPFHIIGWTSSQSINGTA